MTEPANDPAANSTSEPNNEPGAKGGDGEKLFTQAEVDGFIKSRAERIAAQKYGDYDTLKEKASQHDALLEELSSDAEKAAKKAREEALAEANSKTIPKVVRQAFRAEAKGVLTKEQLDSLLEDRDLTKYVTTDGEPDEEKIAKLVAAFAPSKDGDGDRKFPDLGGGNRGGAAKTTDMNALIRRAAGVST